MAAALPSNSFPEDLAGGHACPTLLHAKAKVHACVPALNDMQQVYRQIVQNHMYCSLPCIAHRAFGIWQF